MFLSGDGLRLSEFLPDYCASRDLALDLGYTGGWGTVTVVDYLVSGAFSVGLSVRPNSLAILEVKLYFSGAGGYKNTSL